MNATVRNLLSSALSCALIALLVPTTAGAIANSEPDAPVELVLCFNAPTISANAFNEMSALGVPAQDIQVIRPDMAIVTLDSQDDPDRFQSRMEARSDVDAVALNGTVRALESIPPNDPVYTGVTRAQRTYLGPSDTTSHTIEIEPVWDAVFNGDSFAAVPDRPGVTIAVIDTGVSPALADDTGEYVPVWDYANSDADTRDDYYPYYHGTRVAQMIRARTDNGSGLSGLLYNMEATVLVYKSLNSAGSGTTAQSVQAMRDAADDGAKIINMSLGERATLIGGAPNTSTRALWQAGVDYCVAKGALVVAASGNDADKGHTSVFYPAACSGALAVGSIDADTGQRSDFSCYGPELDIMAPGQLVDSSPATSSKGPWQMPPNGVPDTRLAGTSFAAPQVSGSLALLWSLVPRMSATRLTEIVTTTADGSYGPNPGRDDETGWGLLDVYAAYAEMTRTIDVQDTVSVTARHTQGIEASLTWPAAEGSGVSYAYGYEGGPAYLTTGRTGRLMLPGSGAHDVWVRSFATDRWSASVATTTVTVPGSFAPLDSVRLAGDNRYETAAAISGDGFASAGTVVLALGSNWPDALSATVLAHATSGPILLVERSRMPIVTKDELLRLRPSRVYVVGGTSAIASSVDSTVRSLLPTATVSRLAGRDRFDTARIVAQTSAELPGVFTDGTIVLASGENYPDALAGAPVAAAAGWPILLTKKGVLPSATQSALGTLKPTKTILLGGAHAISSSVAARVPSPTRWSGADRYETSRIIADRAFSAGVLTSAELGIATGDSFPDALTAGPRAAGAAAPVVLVREGDRGLSSWLDVRGSRFGTVTVHGGRSVIPYDLELDILYALRRP